jgi:general secretion pathway protein G
MRRIILLVCFLVFATIAISSHLRSVHKAEEAMRVEDALVLQQAIDAYTVDTGKAPQSLDDLVKAGYLKAIPGHHVFIESDPLVPQNGRT